MRSWARVVWELALYLHLFLLAVPAGSGLEIGIEARSPRGRGGQRVRRRAGERRADLGPRQDSAARWTRRRRGRPRQIAGVGVGRPNPRRVEQPGSCARHRHRLHLLLPRTTSDALPSAGRAAAAQPAVFRPVSLRPLSRQNSIRCTCRRELHRSASTNTSSQCKTTLPVLTFPLLVPRGDCFLLLLVFFSMVIPLASRLATPTSS